MATCPDCEFDEIDTEDYDEGDTLTCPECGKTLAFLGADELELVDAAEERDVTVAPIGDQRADGPDLGDRLHQEHPGDDGVLGEVPREERLVRRRAPAADGSLVEDDLEDLVDQEERRPVRDDVLGARHRVAGRPPHRAHDARAARNLVGVSLGLTLYQASWTFPLAPTRNDERMMPM